MNWFKLEIHFTRTLKDILTQLMIKYTMQCLVLTPLLYLPFTTAGSDYETGPYTVDFTIGQLYATLMVSTMDDNTTELAEYFSVMVISTDQPGAVEIGSYDMALVTIEDNDPGVCTQLKVLCAFVCFCVSI